MKTSLPGPPSLRELHLSPRRLPSGPGRSGRRRAGSGGCFAVVPTLTSVFRAPGLRPGVLPRTPAGAEDGAGAWGSQADRRCPHRLLHPMAADGSHAHPGGSRHVVCAPTHSWHLLSPHDVQHPGRAHYEDHLAGRCVLSVPCLRAITGLQLPQGGARKQGDLVCGDGGGWGVEPPAEKASVSAC